MFGFIPPGVSPKPQKPKRLKRFTVTAKQFAELLEGGTHTRELREGMPSGAIIRESKYKPDTGTLELVAEHQDFDPVPEGQKPPEARISVLPAKAPEPEARPVKWREWT